jgi:hypothetical protein
LLLNSSGVFLSSIVLYTLLAFGLWQLVTGCWPACDELSRVEARSKKPEARLDIDNKAKFYKLLVGHNTRSGFKILDIEEKPNLLFFSCHVDTALFRP